MIELCWNILYQNDGGVEGEDREEMERMVEGKCPD